MKTKLLSIIAAAALAMTSFAALTVTASAETISGTVGTASYTIEDEKVLTVKNGSFTVGEWQTKFAGTSNSSNGTAKNPYANSLSQSITKVVFEDGVTITNNPRNMFYHWNALNTVDMSGLSFGSSVTSMSYMFYSSAVEMLDFGSLDTSKITLMNGVFESCKNLKSLDLSSLDTTNVTQMQTLFKGCSSLQDITYGDSFSTSKVTDMNNMFYACGTLKVIDLSRYDTANVTKMNYMFWNCNSLVTIMVGSGWNTDKANNSFGMFGSCTNLVGGKGTAYTSNIIDKTYAKVDGGESDPGYLTAATIPATATYAQVGNDYETSTGDAKKDTASLWKITVTAGIDSIETLDVKLGNVSSKEGAQSLDTPVITGAEVVLGVVTNLSGTDTEAKGFTVVVNGSDIAAAKASN